MRESTRKPSVAHIWWLSTLGSFTPPNLRSLRCPSILLSTMTQPNGFRPRILSLSSQFPSTQCGYDSTSLWRVVAGKINVGYKEVDMAFWIQVIGLVRWLRPLRVHLKACFSVSSVLWQIVVAGLVSDRAALVKFGFLLRLVVVWLCGGAGLAALNKIWVPLAVGLLKFMDAKFLGSTLLWIVMIDFLVTTI